MSVKVFVVDDHELVRLGLRGYLEADGDLHVIGEAATTEQAVSLIPLAAPDVALLDLRLPDGNGIELCRYLTLNIPDLASLIFTGFADDVTALAAQAAGASGLLSKTATLTEVRQAIRGVASGKSLFASNPPQKRFPNSQPRGSLGVDTRLANLSRRELVVAELIAGGRTNREIADELSLNVKTVRNYVTRILWKTGFQRRTGVAGHIARVCWHIEQRAG